MIHSYSSVFGTEHKIDGFGKQTRESELEAYFPVMYPTMRRFLIAIKEIPPLVGFAKRMIVLSFNTACSFEQSLLNMSVQ